LAPGILHFLTPAFPGKWVATVGLTLVLGEKVWAMFLRMPSRVCRPARGDWTAITALYANTAVAYLALFDFYLQVQSLSWFLAGISAVVLVVAVGLRYWALRTLGAQVKIHVDNTQDVRQLTASGPYLLLRHPVYLAACVELLALCMALCSPAGLLCALFVFVPVELHRAWFEEKSLRRLFGRAYEGYAATTWAFLPIGSFLRPGTDQKSSYQ
jgi:protein-S-isoprenylcysteine O-methyltransferase Ste14